MQQGLRYSGEGHIGHVMIGRNGRIVDLDEGYAALVGLTRDAAIGRPATDLVPAEERDITQAFVDGAWSSSGRTAYTGTQRHRQADGGMVWVGISASQLGKGDAAVVVASVRLLCRQLESGSVQGHWQMARLLLASLDDSKRAFGASLVGNPAAEILLLAYLAEAEAEAIPAGLFADRIGMAWPLVNRWIAALIDAGFAEPETAGPVDAATPIRLSPRALALIEGMFGSLITALRQPRVTA